MNISPIRKRKVTDEDKEEVWKTNMLNQVYYFYRAFSPDRIPEKKDFIQSFFEQHPCRCPTCEFAREALSYEYDEGRKEALVLKRSPKKLGNSPEIPSEELPISER